MSNALPPFQRLIYFRDLLQVLVARDMKLRYKRSILGVAWSLAHPLLQLLVFYIVFSFILPVSTEHFALFLFVGLLAWNWFQSAVQLGCVAITDHAALVRQPGFVPGVLPLVTVLSTLLHFVIALPIVLAGAAVIGLLSPAALLVLPLVILTQFILTLSLVFALAAIHVSFRDTQYLVNIVLLLGFYLSPVLYKASVVPERFRWAYELNPLASILESYRRILLQGEYPQVGQLGMIAVLSCVALVVAYKFFNRASRWFAEEIGS